MQLGTLALDCGVAAVAVIFPQNCPPRVISPSVKVCTTLSEAQTKTLRRCQIAAITTRKSTFFLEGLSKCLRGYPALTIPVVGRDVGSNWMFAHMLNASMLRAKHSDLMRMWC